MPPIPVHIDDPISPTKATRTAPQLNGGASGPANNTNATTTAPSHENGPAYPIARPGAPAMPAPTPFLPNPQPAPTRTTEAAPQQDFPPAPQPGAAPVPPTQTQTSTSDIPPPPTTSSTAQQAPVPPPPQTSYIPPQQNLAPTHSTDTSAPTSTRAGPTTLSLGLVSSPAAAHPPGYQQNAYAQDLSPAQRASLDQQEERERRGSLLGNVAPPEAGGAAGNVWNAVRDFGSKAGEKAVEVHGEVWKWIDKK